jgi:hypothetical protein
MKDKPITLGYIAWHDKIGDTDASVVQIYKNAGGERRAHGACLVVVFLTTQLSCSLCQNRHASNRNAPRDCQ